jgi:hypothetical protein
MDQKRVLLLTNITSILKLVAATNLVRHIIAFRINWFPKILVSKQPLPSTHPSPLDKWTIGVAFVLFLVRRDSHAIWTFVLLPTPPRAIDRYG